jgi:hypothetical protein
MARDWLDLVSNIEAAYPRAIGGSSRDEPLRLQLVPFANNAMKEVERIRRWSLAYGTAQQITFAGNATYAIPAAILVITNLYWLDTTGFPRRLEDYTARELREVYGEGSTPPRGAPVGFAILGTNVQLFPVPDSAGPSSGNYTLIFEGYQVLQPIVETTGTIAGAPSTTLTVPSTNYLTQRNVPVFATGLGVSIRGAGYPQSATVFDDWLTDWSAMPSGTTVTLAAAAPTNVATAQTFFNSTNWLIQDYPKLLEFAVMREVASYLLSDDYQKWEARYQTELELMADFHFDRLATLETLAVAVTGQRQNSLRRLDYPMGYEVRGGVL